MDIYLVRHGEAAASWSEDPDPGLSELGRQQARAAAEQLYPKLAADACLLTSPLSRARETAGPLAAMLDAPVHVDDVFTEVPSPVSLAQRQAWLRAFMTQQWHEQPESLQAWRTAIMQGVLNFEQPTVVFTHFLVINAVVGNLLQRPETLCCWPDNGSVTALRLADGTLELVALGEQMKTVVN